MVFSLVDEKVNLFFDEETKGWQGLAVTLLDHRKLPPQEDFCHKTSQPRIELKLKLMYSNLSPPPHKNMKFLSSLKICSVWTPWTQITV